MVARDTIRRYVQSHEGRRSSVYPDTEGHLTVGVGCNLDRAGCRELFESQGIDYDLVRQGKMELTRDQINSLYDHDLGAALADVKTACPAFDSLPDNAQLALWDCSFQLGLARLQGFHKMLRAISEGDWLEASRELLNSQLAKQTPVRALENAVLLRTCAAYRVDAVDLVAHLELLRPTSRDREA